ncbi:hypothetical protein [Psychromonas ossibalaenae]|uniref:hypothetical protein n=1 Tax=Psychromonas ossibalaenae TaxID=444922 RepID=UPI000372FA88|nr:hypothetical protein [Psychromonas ossibalaenae]
MKKLISMTAAVIISMSVFISPVSALQQHQTLDQQAVYNGNDMQEFLLKRCTQGCAH